MFIYSSSQQIHLYWKGEQWHAAFNHILIHILAHTLSHRLFMVIKGEEMYSRSLSLSLEENGAEESTNTAIIVILNNFIMFARCNMQFAIVLYVGDYWLYHQKGFCFSPCPPPSSLSATFIVLHKRHYCKAYKDVHRVRTFMCFSTYFFC